MLHMNNTNETKNKMFVWHSILKSLTTEMYNRLVLLLYNANWLSNTVVPKYHFANLITTTICKSSTLFESIGQLTHFRSISKSNSPISLWWLLVDDFYKSERPPHQMWKTCYSLHITSVCVFPTVRLSVNLLHFRLRLQNH